MLRYQNEKTKAYRIMDMTTLTVDEFEQLLLNASNQVLRYTEGGIHCLIITSTQPMPKPFRLPPLDDATVAALQRQYETTTDADLRLRTQMVLLAYQGRSVAEIAQIVFRSQDTVLRLFTRMRDGGLAALPRRKAPGPVPTVTPAWEAELLRVIELDPHILNVPSANWTTTALANYLAYVTGITVSEETVRLRLHANGYVCKRPTWTLKRKAEAQAGYVGNA